MARGAGGRWLGPRGVAFVSHTLPSALRAPHGSALPAGPPSRGSGKQEEAGSWPVAVSPPGPVWEQLGQPWGFPRHPRPTSPRRPAAGLLWPQTLVNWTESSWPGDGAGALVGRDHPVGTSPCAPAGGEAGLGTPGRGPWHCRPHCPASAGSTHSRQGRAEPSPAVWPPSPGLAQARAGAQAVLGPRRGAPEV